MNSSPRDDRQQRPDAGDERTLIVAFLEWQRSTFRWKCADLTPEQLVGDVIPVSDMTLLGMLRHLTDVERSWFQKFDGSSVEPLYRRAEDADADWRVPAPDQVQASAVSSAWKAWEDAVAASRRITDSTPFDALSAPRRDGRVVAMRWILLHMIEEYARHNGHADLIRQTLDGSVGE